MENDILYNTHILGKPLPHDHKACNALAEYEKECTLAERSNSRLPSMKAIPQKYGTTIEEMKKHWHCIDLT